MEEEVKFPDHTKAVSVLRRDEEDLKLNKYKASNSTQYPRPVSSKWKFTHEGNLYMKEETFWQHFFPPYLLN